MLARWQFPAQGARKAGAFNTRGPNHRICVNPPALAASQFDEILPDTFTTSESKKPYAGSFKPFLDFFGQLFGQVGDRARQHVGKVRADQLPVDFKLLAQNRDA